MIISISAVFKIMKLVAFFLVCLGLAECTTLRRPGDKALKDAIKCFRTTLNAFEEVTKFKDEVIETNLALKFIYSEKATKFCEIFP